MKIVFYESRNGELVKVKELFRLADDLNHLIQNPPEEFFEMMKTARPIHGWAEIDGNRVAAYLIFSPDQSHVELDREAFAEWLRDVKPDDFRKTE